MAKSTVDGTIDYKPVESTFNHIVDKTLTITPNDTKVTVTPEHPFYVHNIGWVRAENLKVGDQLDTRSGMTIGVIKIESSQKTSTRVQLQRRS